MLKLECRRSSIEVVADILRLGEASKTEIMYSVHLSYNQLRRYVSRLLRLELLDKAVAGDRLIRYRVTRKGLKLLRDIDTVLEMLEAKESTNVWHEYNHSRAATFDN